MESTPIPQTISMGVLMDEHVGCNSCKDLELGLAYDGLHRQKSVKSPINQGETQELIN